jgi:hypothetical protein
MCRRLSIHFICVLIPAAVCISCLTSCANSVPEVLSSSSTVVFDYHDEKSVPQVRLSVFTETGSDARRAARIRVASKSDEYEWTTGEPQLIGSDNRQWAGYTNFVVPDAGKITQGVYDLFYTDAEGRTVQNSFSVSYPEKLAGSKASAVQSILGPAAKEMVAAYMADGTLVYYDARKPAWKDTDAIWNALKLASSIRLCWTSADGSVVCLLPDQERPSSQNKNK